MPARVEVGGEVVEKRDDRIERHLERVEEPHPEVAALALAVPVERRQPATEIRTARGRPRTPLSAESVIPVCGLYDVQPDAIT